MTFLAAFQSTGGVPQLEASILQLRKALETIAFASVAPDKKQYAAFRATAVQSADFTKDYHAGRIFTALAKVNKDFYPLALLPPERQPDRTLQFGRKASGYLTKKKFETAYDRLGKHLHARNPWSGNRNLHNLAADLPTIVEETHSLLDLHASGHSDARFSRRVGRRNGPPGQPTTGSHRANHRPICRHRRIGATPAAKCFGRTTKRTTQHMLPYPN